MDLINKAKDIANSLKDSTSDIRDTALGKATRNFGKFLTNDGTNAILDIDGFHLRKVLEFSFTFDQATDKENQPSGIPRGGRLFVKVDAFTKKNDNNELFKWMVSNNMKKNGKITVYMPSQPGNKLKEIKFEDAYCVKYEEKWKASTSDSYDTEEIYITWRKLTWDNVTYENEWL
jgi:type VI protein secretion system component Hcp